MILITYWCDSDEETITNIMTESDEECQKICEVLKKYNMDILSVDTLEHTITAEELERNLKDIYED